jgi:hypothetical protein
MLIIWTQFANAMTMISPLISCIHHRFRNGQISRSKQILTKWLLIHIPISFGYHLVSAFQTVKQMRCLRKCLKVADLSMIHLYALKTAHVFIKKHNIKKKLNIHNIALLMNSLCIVRICSGNEDTLVRILGLYVCSYNALCDENKSSVREIAALGGVSSALFFFDDNLNSVGHSLFHILLGFLHHSVLKLV